MSNYGKRMVRESKIKEIGQGGSGTTVSGTNDGTNWTSLTIDDDTYGIPQGGGSTYTAGTGIDITNDTISVNNTIATKSDISTVAPLISYTQSYNDVWTELQEDNPEATLEQAIVEWCKRMPIFLNQDGSADTITTLETYGYKNIITESTVTGKEWKVQGYFGLATTTSTSPYTFQHVQICMTESSTGSLDNKRPTSIFVLTKISKSQYKVSKARFSADNTKIMYLGDPTGSNIGIVVGFNSNGMSNAIVRVYSDVTNCRNGESAEITSGYGNTDVVPGNYNLVSQLGAPTTEGDYLLKCSVDNTLNYPTFSWATPTTGTSIYAHTANFVLNDGSSGDSYTVTMQFNYGTQTGLDAVAFEGLFDSVTGEFAYPYTAYFSDGVNSTLYPCRLTFGGTLFVLEPFPNADHTANIIDLELDELGFRDVGIAY